MSEIISIRNLKKSYRSRGVVNDVLKGINLDIEAGKIIGYIGPNGAGKSTTVKILCGILEDYSGDIKIFDLPLENKLTEIKRRIGYIPENDAIYDTLSPWEFLGFIASLYNIDVAIADEKIKSFLDFFEIEDVAHKRMSTFSKGMKQKVKIISGLLHNPDIIFMDEPLSGLDANSVILVKELVNSLVSNGKTVFYCSHLMDVVENMSDEIVMIDNGSIIAKGSCKELMQKEGVSSLENLFVKLTGNAEQKEKTYSFMKNI